MSVRLPSRYEDLDTAFRGRLKPNTPLIDVVKQSFQSMRVSGGIRFLPLYGQSGSGKTCAARELATHLPSARVFLLSPDEIESQDDFDALLSRHIDLFTKTELLIWIVDQYEETVAERANLPTQFVERLSLLDRGRLRDQPMLFLWLTTSREFQRALADATTRNSRILVSSDFELLGPPRETWPEIIEETCRFHNNDRSLADFHILQTDLETISKTSFSNTIGAAIQTIGHRLFAYAESLQDLSEYQVVMLWPVTDGLRITRVQQFTNAREGYRLDWNNWYREFSSEDRAQLPLHEYNRARLYFDRVHSEKVFMVMSTDLPLELELVAQEA